jgi:hypothetical protein
MAPIQDILDRVRAMFARRGPVTDIGGLEDFIDQHAAFGVQKCMVEYCRARAGIQWSKLFKEKDFVEALNQARWRAYPIGVGNVTEMIDAALRPAAGKNGAAITVALTGCGRHVLQRHPVPGGEADDFWIRQIAILEERMGKVGLRPPKPVKDIPTPTAKQIFDLLPIHPELRGHDFEVIKNNLRVNLCRSYEIFIGRAKTEVLIEDLLKPAVPVKVPAV